MLGRTMGDPRIRRLRRLSVISPTPYVRTVSVVLAATFVENVHNIVPDYSQESMDLHYHVHLNLAVTLGLVHLRRTLNQVFFASIVVEQ